MRNMQEMIELKEDNLNKRQGQIEDLDRKVLDLERALEAADIKRQGIVNASEQQKKQQNERITGLVEQLQQAKDDIKFWTDKFQKEQTEHSNTQKQMIQAKSDQKDAELFAKNQQIEASSLKRELDVIKARNAELQTSSNEIAATNESMGRQMNTDKVIME